MDIKRVAPKSWMGKKAAVSITSSQDLIAIVADIYKLSYTLETMAKPGLGDPVNEVVHKAQFWDVQDDVNKQMAYAIMELGRVRRRMQFLTARGLR
jgi:hypothetical protein